MNKSELQSIKNCGSDLFLIPTLMDGHITKQLVFNTRELVSIKNYLEMMPMSKKVFVSILSQFLELLRKVDELSLDSRKVHFDMEHVFVVPSIRKLKFVYVPIEDYTVNSTADDFLRNLVQYASFSEYEDSSYMNEYINIINRDYKISMYDLSVYLSILTNGNVCSSNTHITSLRCWNCNAILKRGNQFCPACGERIFKENIPCIIRQKTQEKTLLDTNDLILGKNRNECKVFIGDNPLVSRKHALISSKNGCFFLIDMGSTNGTYINGIKLQSGDKYRLRNDDKFYLANELFVFYM
ncbi:MAG: FHA domain-containing protein [Saccharofermentans sp.]|nr:FHA domain-containing protein [Saccharofermentans sp.]